MSEMFDFADARNTEVTSLGVLGIGLGNCSSSTDKMGITTVVLPVIIVLLQNNAMH